jgi:signal peptidase I
VARFRPRAFVFSGFALTLSLLAALALSACGSSSSAGQEDTKTYTYPSESMEPTIAYKEEVTVDLGAYKKSQPAVGDIVAFHLPGGGETAECGVRHPASQPCPQAITGPASGAFIKRVVAGPGDQVSIREGLPVVNGKIVFANDVQKCAQEDPAELCDLPTPITISAGHYFVIGDNSGASLDSRLAGPVPRAAIFGKLQR